MTWRTSSGKRRATTPTPSTHRTPPDTTANWGVGQRRDDGRLDVAEARAAGDDQDVDRHDAAAQVVRRLELDEGRAEDRREDVGGAGEGQEHQRQRERHRHQPERGDGEAPDRGPRAGSPGRSDGPPGPSPRTAPRGTRRRPAPPPSARARPGPVPNTSSARTGKSEVGIPKIIALRSMTNEPRIARRVACEAQALADGLEPGPDDDPDAAAAAGWPAAPRTTR